MNFQLHTRGQTQGCRFPCCLGYCSLLRFCDVHQCFSGSTRDSKTGPPATFLQPVIATCQPLSFRVKEQSRTPCVITQHKAEQSCPQTLGPVQSVPSPPSRTKQNPASPSLTNPFSLLSRTFATPRTPLHSHNKPKSSPSLLKQPFSLPALNNQGQGAKLFLLSLITQLKTSASSGTLFMWIF